MEKVKEKIKYRKEHNSLESKFPMRFLRRWKATMKVKKKTLHKIREQVQITIKTQQNSKCRLCGDRDETINHIISKLAQKEYKTRHDWVGKVIHWEMCKKFKFDHTNKWNMHNPAPVQGNNTYKLLWDWHTHGSPNLDQKTRPYNNQ